MNKKDNSKPMNGIGPATGKSAKDLLIERNMKKKRAKRG